MCAKAASARLTPRHPARLFFLCKFRISPHNPALSREEAIPTSTRGLYERQQARSMLFRISGLTGYGKGSANNGRYARLNDEGLKQRRRTSLPCPHVQVWVTAAQSVHRIFRTSSTRGIEAGWKDASAKTGLDKQGWTRPRLRPARAKTPVPAPAQTPEPQWPP